MKSSEVDVLIIGAGPAGLSAALELSKVGVTNIRVIEREKSAGGVPRHSFHYGYGLRDLFRFLAGPSYAKKYLAKVLQAGISISTSTTATGWRGVEEIELTSPLGLESVKARAVLLATGARERGRNARAVAGSRPEGIFTTGSLQQSTYLHDLQIGKRAVIVGAEHVSFSAVMTLAHAAVKTALIITEKSRHETYWPLRWWIGLWYRVGISTNTRLVEILGQNRVTGVRINRNGKEEIIDCDTVVFTADWIPDNELARRGEFAINAQTKSPVVTVDFETSRQMVFAVGNLILPIKAADQCAIEARKVARIIAQRLQNSLI